MNEERYSGIFRAEPYHEDREIWSDNLSEVKQWIVRRLEECPTPDYARIKDHVENLTIYMESGQDE